MCERDCTTEDAPTLATPRSHPCCAWTPSRGDYTGGACLYNWSAFMRAGRDSGPGLAESPLAPLDSTDAQPKFPLKRPLSFCLCLNPSVLLHTSLSLSLSLPSFWGGFRRAAHRCSAMSSHHAYGRVQRLWVAFSANHSRANRAPTFCGLRCVRPAARGGRPRLWPAIAKPSLGRARGHPDGPRGIVAMSQMCARRRLVCAPARLLPLPPSLRAAPTPAKVHPVILTAVR